MVPSPPGFTATTLREIVACDEPTSNIAILESAKVYMSVCVIATVTLSTASVGPLRSSVKSAVWYAFTTTGPVSAVMVTVAGAGPTVSSVNEAASLPTSSWTAAASSPAVGSE